MGATHDDKEAWTARYKLNEAEDMFNRAIELVNESEIHYEHVGVHQMVDECQALKGLFTPVTERFGVANRKAIQEEP